jgi:threonine dehydratase
MMEGKRPALPPMCAGRRGSGTARLFSCGPFGGVQGGPVLRLEDIEAARERIRPHVHHTPVRHSTTFSRMTGAELHLKLENLQRTGSFKVRGATNKILTLSPDERERGVIAASAGNHAQGVALAATTLGIKSVIVMPRDAAHAKVEATRRYGARVVLEGDDYDAAYRRARELQEEHGYTFVHAFNDPAIMAGQGTVGLELLEDFDDLDTVVVSIGGGGLISGIATAIKSKRPKIRVIGVEAEGAAAAYASRQAGHVVELPSARTIADGIATRTVGDLTFQVMQKHVDEIVTVNDREIARAILLLMERGKTVVEGAGAAGLAALLSKRVDVTGERVAVVVSGGNIDITLLGEILQRGLMEEGRFLRFTTVLPDRPGALKGVIDLIAAHRGNLLRILHDRELPGLSLDQTLVDIEVETRGEEHLKRLVTALKENGYEVQVRVGA